jgi:hypothetical protein
LKFGFLRGVYFLFEWGYRPKPHGVPPPHTCSVYTHRPQNFKEFLLHPRLREEEGNFEDAPQVAMGILSDKQLFAPVKRGKPSKQRNAKNP